MIGARRLENSLTKMRKTGNKMQQIGKRNRPARAEWPAEFCAVFSIWTKKWKKNIGFVKVEMKWNKL